MLEDEATTGREMGYYMMKTNNAASKARLLGHVGHFFGGHVGTKIGSFWCDFGPFLDRSRVIFGPFWDHFGIIYMSFWSLFDPISDHFRLFVFAGS